MSKIVIGVISVLGAMVLAAPAFGGVSACSNPQTLDPSVVGAGNGCSTVDDTFVDFNANLATGTGDTSWPVPSGGATSDISFFQSGPGPTVLDFVTAGTSSGSGSCASNSWCTPAPSLGRSSQTDTQQITFDAQTGGSFFGLSLSEGTVQSGTTKAGDQIKTFEQFCLGSATFNCVQGDSNYGYLEVLMTSTGSGGFNTVYTVCTPGAGGCTTSTPGIASINFLAQTEIGISETVSIRTVTGETAPVFIDSFDSDFIDAPEPSTFVLLGSALVGLLHLRRKNA